MSISFEDSYGDYQHGDEWDWDKQDPRQYCEHGTFIGSFWGPDILCSQCEAWDETSKSPDDYEM